MTEELAFTDRDSLPDWAKRYPPTGSSCCRWQQNRVLSPHHEARGVRSTPESMAAPQNLHEEWRGTTTSYVSIRRATLKPPASVSISSSKECFMAVYDWGASVVKVNNWGYLLFG